MAIAINSTVTIDQCVSAALAVGAKRTILFQGDMGSGKTSILWMLAKELPNHIPIYFDATTKDLGDLMVPMFDKIGDDNVVRYALNEELGFHHKKPVILMIDELGKANPAVKNGLLRVMLEQACGSEHLPDGSIVIATTNLGAEGVGDILPAHARNRITIMTMRKSDNVAWMEWGINNGIDTSILGWAKETPQLFQSFTEVKDPDDNPYIFHPRAPDRTSFVTPRSLEAASDWVKQRHQMDRDTLTAGLIGTIGERGARDLAAFVSLADQLPKMEDLINNPDIATVPTAPAAVCMVVYRTLATIEYKWVDNWMKYMSKLNREAQGLFVNGVRSEKYGKRDVVTNCKGYQDWCMDNGWMVQGEWRTK
jgi:hypothetical protein